ncbi:hypothetical protein K2173_002755 [Erythroxylum novogranatense]|uniref:Fucosyltransferase n=1 Tax=Erythroxylum novogranatense TaxID=1862640 RepID=A0AAV8SQW7_9ROSI|nr:hypothetical protein K2173_002755 [Erythroxylum novogranatense]
MARYIVRTTKLCMHDRIWYLRLTILVVGFAIALTLSHLVSITFPTTKSNPIQGCAKDMSMGLKVEGVASLAGDSGEDLEVRKRLGGLLAPGNDEGSCISRHQTYMYRKSSPHLPSKYLISKLRQYEDRHRRCGPFTEAYNRSIRGLNSSPLDAISNTDCKYVVWVGSGGLGNMIISMASLFNYALLTNRVLLVKHGDDVANLFCEPFPNTSWLLPEDFPLNKQFDMFDIKKFDGNSSVSVKDLPSFLYINLVYEDGVEPYYLFFRDETQTYLQGFPWLALKSDQYHVPAQFMMKSLEPELNRFFPDKASLFHHLSRYLFHPSNRAWGLISRFYQAYMERADQRIGIQVRIFGTKQSPFHLVLKQILSCTQGANLLPKAEYNRCKASPPKHQTSKAITIASLYPFFYQEIKNLYLMNPTVTGEVIAVHQPSHEEKQKLGDNVHNLKAWADIYILSLNDVLVTSAWSTFGYVAQGLAGVKSWILELPGRHSVPNPPCRPSTSSEPCLLLFPNYNPGNLPPYIKNCEDAKLGLKLVN